MTSQTPPPDDMFQNAVAAIRAGALDRAAALAGQVLDHAPGHAGALHLLGCAHLQQGRPASAAELIARSIAADGGTAASQYNLAHALMALDRPHEAESALRAALAQAPDHGEAWLKLGECLQKQRRYAEAVPAIQHAGQGRPPSPDLLASLGNALYLKGDTAAAKAACRQALDIAPHHGGAWINLGNALMLEGDTAAAADCFTQAMAGLAPDSPDHARARFARACARLRRGDMGAGWADYEARQDGGSAPVAWQGKTLLVDTEQGFGDTFQALRYLPVLAQGARVILRAAPRLLAVLRTCADLAAVTLISRDDPPPPHDYRIGMMSLPGLLWDKVGYGAQAVPYLRVPPDRVAVWRQRLAQPGKRLVGLNWQGSTTFGLDHFRSLPATALAPLGALDDVTLISLHHPRDAAAEACLPLRVFPDMDQDGAFLDSAAIMTGLDLMVTSDTSTAHLAGALGVPTCVMLSAYPDWRWHDHRADSPWYPSLRLIRQTELGRWDDVAREIVSILKQPGGAGFPLACLGQLR